jgi:rSAM/selenodomain-associated transferase 1
MERILLFVKAPTPGQVKTRLASTLGPENAAALYRAFVLDFLVTLRKTGYPLTVLFHPEEARESVREWLGGDLELRAQEGLDLGHRLDHAFRHTFRRGAKKILALGGDTPDLPESMLHEAFSALSRTSAAVVPALDGGYAAIGFAAEGYCPEAFRGISWGTEVVLEQTLAILAARKTSISVLPPWPDIDTPADLDALGTRLEESLACPAVRAFLGTEPWMTRPGPYPRGFPR